MITDCYKILLNVYIFGLFKRIAQSGGYECEIGFFNQINNEGRKCWKDSSFGTSPNWRKVLQKLTDQY